MLSFLTSLTQSVGKLTAEECMALGLNKNFLMCSSCDALKEFSLDSLESECKSCCDEDDVQAFVKSDRPAAFPNLAIKYVRGADPVIKLMDEEGEVMETLAIDKWNTDSVEEFLNTYLLTPGVSDDDFSAFDAEATNNEI
ncbi:Selenoprotein Sep15/SelM [Trinorchestia longiramus]|nr:Selenoprotein Sep15/SelM [Trinorchestia longiramus]